MENINNQPQYQYRYIVRFTVEASTPIAVGSGMGTILTDSPVIRDVNGLPYIPATSLAGVIRHELSEQEGEDFVNDAFGFHDKYGGEGSRIVFTDAVMVGKDALPVDGIQSIDWNDDFYRHYHDLCIRNHVRIGSDGVAEDAGKYDNEVVYKGTRFVFEAELVSEKERKEMFCKIVSALSSSVLRIGSGTRCGYGKLSVKKCERAILDLCNADDLKLYAQKSSCLSAAWAGFSEWKPTSADPSSAGWTRYVLSLQPVDFYMFGSGSGDDDADNVPVSESVVEWNGGKPAFADRRTLIPAASVKGALAHRTAYNYNKVNHLYVGNPEAKTGDENLAVAAIFGKAAGKDGSRGSRGGIILSDLLEYDIADAQKLFYHIQSDYFSGGTIDGALFQEKSVHGKGQCHRLELLVADGALADDKVKEAFVQSLRDICDGLLPLGGVTGRGNGFFTGTLTENDKRL